MSTTTSIDPLLLIFAPLVLAILHLLLDKSFVYQNYKTPRYIHFIVPLGLLGLLIHSMSIYWKIFTLETVLRYELDLNNLIGNSFEMNPINGLLAVLVLFISTAVAFYSLEYMKDDENVGLYFFLFLVLISGMIAVLLATDFLTLYLAYEVVGLSSYFLVAFRKKNKEAIEASVKYLFMGAAGSITALFGITFIYGVAGSLKYKVVNEAFTNLLSTSTLSMENKLFLVLIVTFIIAGFGVKASIVPFHSWLIDAHPAAPSGISAMLSGLVIKIGVYAILITIVTLNLLTNGTTLLILQLLALITITLPNLLAFNQTDLKRLLAYSSIYNIGIIMIAFSMGTFLGIVAALFHLVSHALMKALAFMGSGYYMHHEHTRDLMQLKGVSKKYKSASFIFSVSIFSLIGFPLTIGFLSKFWVILAALSYDASDLPLGLDASSVGVLIALVVLLNTIIALGYYARVIRVIWMETTTTETEVKLETPPVIEKKLSLSDYWMIAPMLVMALVILALGIFPYQLLDILQKAAPYWIK